MLKKSLATVGLALVLTGSAAAQDAKTVIAAASKAMGGDTLTTIEYSATGFDFVLGQVQPEHSMAEVHEQDVQARDRLQGAGLAGGQSSRPIREPPAGRRTAAGAR